jgi:geranylgeranyl pyrophosphate synthase
MSGVKHENNPGSQAATVIVAADKAKRSVIERVRTLLGDQLSEVENKLLQLNDLQPDELRIAVEMIIKSGGKRVRPMMVLLVAGLFGTAERNRAIELASAVEMLQTATLVHDDLIDGSLVRRNAATLNAIWTPAATVLTGDYLMAYASQLASRVESVRVMGIFSETLATIVGGELRQMFTDWGLRSTRDDYFRRIYAKTASMYVLSSTSAAVISGASEAQFNALLDYGRDFGIAFQIIDDILDFTGDQAVVGKPVGSDLRRGMITLPTIAYAESHPADERIKCALKGACSSADYDGLIDAIRASDAIDTAFKEAAAITNNAKRALDIFPDSEFKTLLCELADYNISRDK